MIGKWEGFYQQRTEILPEEIRNRKTLFTINITKCVGNTFSGTVKDDFETGGMEGIGFIEGSFDSESMTFIKKMPFESSNIFGKILNSKSNSHPPIIYKGNFDNNRTKISGNWIIEPFKKRYKFKLFLAGSYGIFEMNKIST